MWRHFFNQRWLRILLVAALVSPSMVGAWRAEADGRTRESDVPRATAADDSPQKQDLPTRCAAAAKALRPRLGDDCRVIVHWPFVIGGDLSEADLAAWHHRTIEPA